MNGVPREAEPDLTDVVVLLVDDHDDIRELLAELLKQAGAIVESAQDARSALAAFQRRRPDVIVSDIGLPDENGYDLLRRLRQGDAGPPALALTAYSLPKDRAMAFDAGFQQFATKPIESGQFLKLVATLAGR